MSDVLSSSNRARAELMAHAGKRAENHRSWMNTVIGPMRPCPVAHRSDQPQPAFTSDSAAAQAQAAAAAIAAMPSPRASVIPRVSSAGVNDSASFGCPATVTNSVAHSERAAASGGKVNVKIITGPINPSAGSSSF